LEGDVKRQAGDLFGRLRFMGMFSLKMSTLDHTVQA
jgi:hypothetical protein